MVMAPTPRFYEGQRQIARVEQQFRHQIRGVLHYYEVEHLFCCEFIQARDGRVITMAMDDKDPVIAVRKAEERLKADLSEDWSNYRA